MNVLIVNAMTPFVETNADMLAMLLQKNIIMAGHEAEILRIPCQMTPATHIPSQMLMVRAFELSNVDHVIALAFPAYLIRHPRKVLWLLHQTPQASYFLDAPQDNLHANTQDDNIRLLIKNAELECFTESRHIYTNSEMIRQRLKAEHSIDVKILQSPTTNVNKLIGEKPGNGIAIDDWQQTIEVLLQ